MNFCQQCGRQRSGNARFCTGCGAEFQDPAVGDETPLTTAPAPEAAPPAEIPQNAAAAAPWDAAAATAAATPRDEGPAAGGPSGWAPPADATRWDEPAAGTGWDKPVPADATRADAVPDVTRWGPPSVPPPPSAPAGPAPQEPDPFASWFASTQAGQPATPAAGQPAYPPPPGPVPGHPPAPVPAYRPAHQPRRAPGGVKAAFLVAGLLVLAAAGGGAYLLVGRSGKHATAQPPASPATHAASRQASVSSSAGAQSASASVPASASASASASLSRSAKPAHKPKPRLVALTAGVAGNPAAPQVETVLTHYFQGINTRNYAEYIGALDAKMRANQPQSSFDSGYATTKDTGMKLTAIQGAANGGLTVTVTFTSHQAPSDSVDNSACNNWTLNLSLVPDGTGYLIGPEPSGYQPTYSDC